MKLFAVAGYHAAVCVAFILFLFPDNITSSLGTFPEFDFLAHLPVCFSYKERTGLKIEVFASKTIIS